MTGETKKADLVLIIKFRDLEQTFSGSVEETYFAVNKFFSQFLPSFQIAHKLILDIDLESLAEQCTGLIAYSLEGPNILIPNNKLTDNETISLWLLASYLGQKLGTGKSDAVSKVELQNRLGKSSKITSTRLGELAKNGWISKVDHEKYSLSTFGVVQIQKEVLPRIRAKTDL